MFYIQGGPCNGYDVLFMLDNESHIAHFENMWSAVNFMRTAQSF